MASKSEQFLTTMDDQYARSLMILRRKWDDYSSTQQGAIDAYVQRCLDFVGFNDLSYVEQDFANELYQRSRAINAEPSTPGLSDLSQMHSIPSTPGRVPLHLLQAKRDETWAAFEAHRAEQALAQQQMTPSRRAHAAAAPIHHHSPRAVQPLGHAHGEYRPPQGNAALPALMQMHHIADNDNNSNNNHRHHPGLHSPLSISRLTVAPGSQPIPSVNSPPAQHRRHTSVPGVFVPSTPPTAPAPVPPATANKPVQNPKIAALLTALEALAKENRQATMEWQTALSAAVEKERQMADITFRGAALERELLRAVAAEDEAGADDGGRRLGMGRGGDLERDRERERDDRGRDYEDSGDESGYDPSVASRDSLADDGRRTSKKTRKRGSKKSRRQEDKTEKNVG